MLTPAALVDINGDGISDIVIATFSSNVIAFDGNNYKTIWNVTFEKSESYATIAVGYYDEDQIPDFLVKYQYGKGFPTYEYEQVTKIYPIRFICRNLSFHCTLPRNKTKT